VKSDKIKELIYKRIFDVSLNCSVKNF